MVPSSSVATSWSYFHSGFQREAAFVSIHVANPSFSQRLSHHCIVTMSPNHWCDISCATVETTSFFAAIAPSFSSTSSSVSRNVRQPKFSIAPGFEVRDRNQVHLGHRVS